MPFQTDGFKAEIEALSTAAGAKVIRHGAYRRDEMAKLLGAVDWVITPSIWWENAPLVIQEAAGIPLDPSFEEQKAIMLRCNGAFYSCKDGAEARRFNRLLIDAGIIKGL